MKIGRSGIGDFYRGVLRFTTIEELARTSGPHHLALGVFDGVHLGHQAVIGKALAARDAAGGTCGVLTFDPYPIRVLAPEKAPRRLLASLDHKAEILGRMGVDFLLALHFDMARAGQDAEDFVREIIAAGVATIAVGEDWRFGKSRRGDVAMLERLSQQHGFQLAAMPPVMMDGERISSTRIRQAIRDGSMKAAAGMLGRPYTVEGRVVEGRKLGRQIGFPTANVARGEEQFPPDGVWAVRARAGERLLEGVANLGVRPTVDGSNRLLEVHLFGFSGDLYGQVLEVEFLQQLRGERKFESIEALKSQIGRDVEQAMYILRAAGKGS
ncbi:bifunctional riboflavin kinase/FAD synthetase [Haloferula sp. BvORR071]|uniref:bifunctional riboflavin kinase/FAD synthetase n=1 Tax=Haloferula sp. BvORR071 TaxID=1396141 RepID=UPI000698E4E8|nr:bifunctional riboflavin kinase/FAD synthetase [Haloferula sp. BvORR071]